MATNSTSEMEQGQPTAMDETNTAATPEIEANEAKPDEKALIVASEVTDISTAGEAPAKPATKKADNKKPTKEKLSGADKKAHQLANKLASSMTEMEARLYKIYHQLDVEAKVGQPLVIGVTSSLRGEGRSTVALALARTLVNAIPEPILLVEGDLSQPSAFLDDQAEEAVAPENNLVDYLLGEKDTSEQLARQGNNGDLWIIPAGEGTNQSLKAIRSKRLETLFETMRQNFGVIVVDMPPVVISTEAGRWLNMVDKVVMVVEAGSTPRQLVKANLDYVGSDKVAAVLLNRTRPAGPGWLRKLVGIS